MRLFLAIFVTQFLVVSHVRASVECRKLFEEVLNVEVPIQSFSSEQLSGLKGATVEVLSSHTNASGKTTTTKVRGVVQSAMVSSDRAPIIHLRVFSANKKNKLVNFAFMPGGDALLVKVVNTTQMLFDFRESAVRDGLTLRELRHNEPQVRFSRELEALPTHLKMRMLYLADEAGSATVKEEKLSLWKLPTQNELINATEKPVVFQFKNGDNKIIKLKLKEILAFAYPPQKK